MEKKAFLFDYGGTLDTSARHWYYVIKEAYGHADLNFDDADLREAYVYGERALDGSNIVKPEDDFGTMLRKKMDCELQGLELKGLFRLNSEERADLALKLADYCDDYARRTVANSAKVLQVLQERYRLVLVSNFYGNLHSVLRGYGLQDFFPTIIESAVVGVRKPDSRIWQLGIEAAGCAPEEAVVVGDSYGKDVVPAHNLGCETVWFKGEEWLPKAFDESLPTHVITALDQLLGLY